MAKPAAMNVSVATIERAEKRLMPHTPWPLVQPLPRRVPIPTSRPAIASTGALAKLAAIPPCASGGAAAISNCSGWTMLLALQGSWRDT